MQLVVPSAVSAADAAAIMILSRISPHDDFFIIPSFSQFVHRDTKTQSPLCFFTADFSDLKVQSVALHSLFYLPQITQISQIFYL